MRKFCALLFSFVLVCGALAGCQKNSEVETASTEAASETASGSVTLLNVKSEVNSQIEELAAAYTKETGIEVTVMAVPAGVDVSATIKGYYLSDQMPDIIACEASGFANWEGLLVDMSDQEWTKRTSAAYTDATYGTIGFPYTTEAIGLAYNADILSKCGIDPSSITSPDALRNAFETIDAKKSSLGITAVIGYCAEPENLGWSAGNHLFGVYIDSGLSRDDTTYLDQIANSYQVDEARFSDYAAMIELFNEYSDPDLLTKGTYDQQVGNFAAGKYAFVTQGSWIGASLVGDYASEYQAAGSFEVGMVPYAFQSGMQTILTSAPQWWAVTKEGNTEAALAFLQWCSEDAGQKILVEGAGFVSPFTDCKYVASDPFAQTISDYISADKTSNWHWMQLPEGVGNSDDGLCYCFYHYAEGDVDATGFRKQVNSVLADYYSRQ